MAEYNTQECSECSESVNRRRFLHLIGSGASTLAAFGAAPALLSAQPGTPAAHPAEALVQELFDGLSVEQRRHVVLPWDHRAQGNQTLTRLRMTDIPFTRRIGDLLTQAQQELTERALRALCAGDDGFRQISRNSAFDDPNGIRSIGVNIFGDPTGNNPYACIFTGHHMTIRCHRGANPAAVFGGPLYFGHVVHGYSRRNCYYYHTRTLMDLYGDLNEQQRRQAVVRGNPGDFETAVRFRAAGNPRPGIGASDLTADQRRQVEQVMRTLLSPFRAEETDRAMRYVRDNGGVEQIHLAFYEEGRGRQDEPWSSWRLEGPGFVWNVRVLPHVHTYVNIGPRPA
jgi:hypothetical protein